jgi:hypothetical protein
MFHVKHSWRSQERNPLMPLSTFHVKQVLSLIEETHPPFHASPDTIANAPC